MVVGRVLSVILLLSTSAARADVFDDCSQEKNPDLSIKACTIIIESGGKDAAIAYNNRGVVYSDRREYENAIADFSKAIELDPNYAIAYNNRGLAHHGRGEYARAIADFAKATELDSKNACAFVRRSPLRKLPVATGRRRSLPRRHAQNLCQRSVFSVLDMELGH